MQLKLSRSQKTGMTGKVIFKLHAMALLTPEEEDAVKRYKLHKEVVWSKVKVDPREAQTALGAIGKLAVGMAVNTALTIQDLQQGRAFECKEITEMLAIEQDLKQACEVLVQILTAATYFDGDELIDIDQAA